MSAMRQPTFTEDEYIEQERRSLSKNEFLRGAIVAMAGGSARHNAIGANVIAALHNRLRGGRCRVLTSDQRVHIEETGLYTYPDVTVVCGQAQFHPKYRDTLLNPKVVIEVLSDATEEYDRGAKAAHYRSISSLAEYVLVSQAEPRVEHYRRLESGEWLISEYKGEAALLRLPSLGCEIPLAEFYEGVDALDEAPPEADGAA